MITEINTDSYNEERCYLDMTTYDEHGEFKNQVKYDFAKLFRPSNYLLKIKNELRHNYLQDLHEEIICVNDCRVLLEQLDNTILEQQNKWLGKAIQKLGKESK